MYYISKRLEIAGAHNLKLDYDRIQNIAELARLRNMNENVVRCLILYGKSYKPR